MYDNCEDFEEDPLAMDLEPEPPPRWYKKQPEYNPETGEWKCPECGSNLVPREGKYGKFYGCSKFPECRYTSDAKTIDTSEMAKPKTPEKPKYDELHPPKLKPCPFCGGEGIYIIGAMEGRYTWHVSCTKCHATCGYKLDRSQCDAGKDWNTRYVADHENSDNNTESRWAPLYPKFHDSSPDYNTNLDPICHEPEFEGVGAPHWGI